MRNGAQLQVVQVYTKSSLQPMVTQSLRNPLKGADRPGGSQCPSPGQSRARGWDNCSWPAWVTRPPCRWNEGGVEAVTVISSPVHCRTKLTVQMKGRTNCNGVLCNHLKQLERLSKK